VLRSGRWRSRAAPRWSSSEAEYQDWRNTGGLHLAPGQTEGKHLTTAADFAARWGESFRALGWEAGPGHIVKVVFPADKAGAVELIGARIDGIGPAYLAPRDVLPYARVTEVPR
jgi:hypothetical protein